MKTEVILVCGGGGKNKGKKKPVQMKHCPPVSVYNTVTETCCRVTERRLCSPACPPPPLRLLPFVCLKLPDGGVAQPLPAGPATPGAANFSPNPTTLETQTRGMNVKRALAERTSGTLLSCFGSLSPSPPPGFVFS